MVENAATWLEKLESGLHIADAARPRDWLKNPANRKAIAEQCDLWHGPEVMAVLVALFPVDRYLSRKRPSRAILIALSGALALGIVTVATIGFLEHAPWKRSRSAEPFVRGVYGTAMGERIKVPLPDGTLVGLNSGTRIVVEYGARTREVYLARGAAAHAEASFRVPKAQKRPFDVIVGSRTLEVASARFNVRSLTSDTAEITVLEGRVRVLARWPGMRMVEFIDGDASLPDEMVIGPLQTAIVGPEIESVHAVDPKDVAARMEWQRSLK